MSWLSLERHSAMASSVRPGGGPLLLLLLFCLPYCQAQCQGFETFEKVSGMTARGAAMAPLYAGPSLTAECNVRCLSSLGCIAYVTNYDMGACYRLAPSPGSQLVMAAERTHYFEKICLKAVPCDRAWAFERVPGTQLADFDDRRMGNVTSRSDCLDLCLRERSFPCRSAEFVAASATCRLSKETRRSQPGAFGPAPGVDYLENFCTPEEMSGACDFQEQPNTDAGHVDLERSGGTREQCESLCSAARLFPCRSFAFNAAASVCRLSSDDAFTVESAVLTRPRQGFSFFQRGACLNMSLTCTAEAMTVMLRTQQPFSGRIYARDEPAMCQAFGNGQTVTQITMALQRSRCGVIEESNGLYSNIVVVQRHPVLQRKGDRSVKLMCMFEANNRTVASGMNVVTENPGDIDLVNSTAPPPNLRLRITDANGTDVNGATLGDPLFLRVQMDRDSVYGIFPRDLIARSGTTQESITLLDSRGCPTDMTIFPGLTRVEGSRDYQGRFEAFKFSTDAVVRFTVNIQFCLRQCPAPSCGAPPPPPPPPPPAPAPASPPAPPPPASPPPPPPPPPPKDSNASASFSFRRRTRRAAPVSPSDLHLQRQITVHSPPPALTADQPINLEPEDEEEEEPTDPIPSVERDQVCVSSAVLIMAGVGLAVLQVCIVATCAICLCLQRAKAAPSPLLNASTRRRYN